MTFPKTLVFTTAGLFALAMTVGSFTTINTGETGLYINYDGQVKKEILTPGIKFDGIGDIKKFNTRKITVTAENLRPRTQDNTIMKEMDVTVTYSINPNSIYDFFTNYDITNHEIGADGQIQLMASYISRLITSAVNQSVDEFPALSVNSNLEHIQETIQTNLTSALTKNGLIGKINIDSVIIGKADLPEEVIQSVNRVVAAQSALKEQKVKTETAISKAEENRALASTATNASLEYQRNENMRIALEKGLVKLIIVNGAKMDFLPGSFTDK